MRTFVQAVTLPLSGGGGVSNTDGSSLLSVS
jgi:hypothetical protein